MSLSSNDALLRTFLLNATGARDVSLGTRIQSLWSGYGEIRRVHFEGSATRSAVLKVVRPPPSGPAHPAHPRGWAGPRSHARKVRSYEVERNFYRSWAASCPARCPRLLGERELRGSAGASDERWLLLEDLDASGFAERRSRPSEAELDACLRWLASFHAFYLDADVTSASAPLWPEGSYWHLATRPDELAAMAPGMLRDAATALDTALGQARHRTVVHGDAKLANFCFSGDGDARVAAVDFQYVGGGVGVRDVAYLLSCLDESRLERHSDRYLDRYFHALRQALDSLDRGDVASATVDEWQRLYPVAWADFERFLAGWAPQHAKRTGYGARITAAGLRIVQ